MRIHRNISEYNLAMGECKMNLKNYKEAIQYFGAVVSNKPKNIAGWEALIKCLMQIELYEEAFNQTTAALLATEGKPLFFFYSSSILFAMGKSKEALIRLEIGMGKAPKLLKKFIELNPYILQNNQVVDLIARYKKKKKL
jgi:tetratricopeptide (TPR) repeat protein